MVASVRKFVFVVIMRHSFLALSLKHTVTEKIVMILLTRMIDDRSSFVVFE